jgi:hypothetical protein
MRSLLCSLLVLIPAVALADAGPGRIDGTVTDIKTRQPVPRITVLVEPPTAHAAITDEAGHYAFEVPPGTYKVVAIIGNGNVVSTVTVVEGETAQVPFRIDSTFTYERIDIHERVAVPAKPIDKYAAKFPEYSDEAMEKDAWGLAWVWLFISSKGEVIGMQFIKRPGYGLDQIAVERAFGMRFEPARDAQGRAMPSERLWKMEWPSYDWLTSDGLANETPSTGYRRMYWGSLDPSGKACRGAGPMNMGELYPRYRDCTPPDLRALDTAPLITRPHAGNGLKFDPHARLAGLPADARREICQWAADLPNVSQSAEPIDACTERLASASGPVSDFVSCTLARAKGKACANP